MGTFATSIAAWVEKTKDRADEVVRAVAIGITNKVVLRSPVGNPELWAANAQAALQRSEHNVVVDQITANLMSNPANVTAKGNLRRNVRQLAKAYPFRSGQGYVGGRFRGSWQVTIGAAATGKANRIDPGGGETIAAAAAAIASFKAGPPIYITSNLPYSMPLEYGWSSQAEAGVVRVTMLEIEQIFAEAVASVPQ